MIAQALTSNPKLATYFTNSLKFGMADVTIGLVKDIWSKKPVDTIAYNAAKTAAAAYAGGTIGASIGRNVGVVVGSAFGPVGAVAGLVIGTVVGGFIGGTVGSLYIQKGIDAAKGYIGNKIDQFISSSASHSNQQGRDHHFSKSDNYASLGTFGYGNGGGGGCFGGGGGNGGGFGGGNGGNVGGGNNDPVSYLANILGGQGSGDIGQLFNSAGLQTLASILSGIGNGNTGNAGMG